MRQFPALLERVLIDAERGERIIFRETKRAAQRSVHAEDAALLHARELEKISCSVARSESLSCGSIGLTSGESRLICARSRTVRARGERIQTQLQGGAIEQLFL